MRKPTFALALTNAQWERAYVAFGPGVEEILRENPYLLAKLRLKIDVIDKVALALGISRKDPRRCVAIASDLLDQLSKTGDCYILLHTIMYGAGFASQEACAKALVDADLAVVEDRYVYPRRLHAAETRVAEWLKSRLEKHL